MPTLREPDRPEPTIRLWTEMPIGAGEATPRPAAGTYCTCPTLWCEGRTSRHWLSCDASCPPCNPKRRQRRGALDDPGPVATRAPGPGSPSEHTDLNQEVARVQRRDR